MRRERLLSWNWARPWVQMAFATQGSRDARLNWEAVGKDNSGRTELSLAGGVENIRNGGRRLCPRLPISTLPCRFWKRSKARPDGAIPHSLEAAQGKSKENDLGWEIHGRSTHTHAPGASAEGAVVCFAFSVGSASRLSTSRTQDGDDVLGRGAPLCCKYLLRRLSQKTRSAAFDGVRRGLEDWALTPPMGPAIALLFLLL